MGSRGMEGCGVLVELARRRGGVRGGREREERDHHRVQMSPADCEGGQIERRRECQQTDYHEIHGQRERGRVWDWRESGKGPQRVWLVGRGGVQMRWRRRRGWKM